MIQAASRLGPSFATWLRDDPEAQAAILRGKDVEVALTSYAQNTFSSSF